MGVYKKIWQEGPVLRATCNARQGMMADLIDVIAVGAVHRAGYQPLAFIIGMAASDVRNVMRPLPASGSLEAALRPAVKSI